MRGGKKDVSDLVELRFSGYVLFVLVALSPDLHSLMFGEGWLGRFVNPKEPLGATFGPRQKNEQLYAHIGKIPHRLLPV